MNAPMGATTPPSSRWIIRKMKEITDQNGGVTTRTMVRRRNTGVAKFELIPGTKTYRVDARWWRSIGGAFRTCEQHVLEYAAQPYEGETVPPGLKPGAGADAVEAHIKRHAQ